MKLDKKAIALITAGCLALSATSVVFADSISTVVTAVINKVVVMFDATGSSNTNEAEQQISKETEKAKQTIDNLLHTADNDIEKQLEEYKNAQINKKNQELDAIINQLQTGIDAKKQQKLNEYKVKIDEKINREYNKLIDDLTK